MKKTIKKKKTKKKSTTLDTFYLAFIGEHIRLTGQFSTPQGTAVSGIEGYLLDIDDDFFFLGDGPDSIKIAIKRDSIFSVETIEYKDELTKMLDEFPVPEDAGSHN